MKDGVAYLQAGGGIVFDSNPDDEYLETINKMAALGKAITLAEEAAAVSKEGKSQSEKTLPSSVGRYNSLWENLKAFPLTRTEEKAERRKGGVLMIDNYDSFTWNLFQYLCQLGAQVTVVRNDQISVSECEALEPERIVISPGPSWPKDAGISMDVIKAFTGKVPILGVCMGHECFFEVFGGSISHCGEIVHGKTSPIQHDGKGVFEGVPNGIQVTRYHSLAADEATMPKELEVSARTENGIVMGLRHKEFTVEGVQFHPESIKSEHGMDILCNFLKFEGPKW